MKKALSLLLVLILLSPCFACAQSAPTASFGDQLAALQGVTSVTVIEQASPVFAEKYLITFTQPIDWQQPSLGTFEQRIEVGFNSADSYTIIQVGGYNLMDAYFPYDDRPELAYLMEGCNFVNVEYRFFGESCPQGLDPDSVALWEYLTDQNASADFHAIIEAMKSLLPNRWYFCGSSKGGQATNVFAYYYPQDCFAYVAYVAPFAEGIAAHGMAEAVFTTLGDTWLGAEKAAEIRAGLMTILVDLVENRETLQQAYWDHAIECGYQYRDFVTPAILYDMALLESAIQYWQTASPTTVMENLLALKESDPSTYIEQCFNFLLKMGGPENWGTNFLAYPYYIQAKKENGCYYYDFQYLREALETAGATQSLAITQEMEEDILWNVVFTPQQNAAFTYDPSLREAMLTWLDTTTSNILMVYGAVDPWSATRLPDTDNPHVTVYILPDQAHSAFISYLTDEAQLMDAYLRLLPQLFSDEE